MGAIFDLLDDLIIGPFNVIDRVEGLITGIRYGDMGHQFAIGRADKGADHTLVDCEKILKPYHIAVYGRTHDSKRVYFHVKKRQAAWAEYVLLRAGVELLSSPVEARNAGWAGGHADMPTPWSERKRQPRKRRERRR